MGKKDFDEYIDSIKSKTEITTIDWNKEKNDWLEYLNLLYNKIEQWIHEYVKAGKIVQTYKEKEIVEEKEEKEEKPKKTRLAISKDE